MASSAAEMTKRSAFGGAIFLNRTPCNIDKDTWWIKTDHKKETYWYMQLTAIFGHDTPQNCKIYKNSDET